MKDSTTNARHTLPPATATTLLQNKIKRSHWWQTASRCVDSHYSNTSGVMLTDHLLAVTHHVDAIFSETGNPFVLRLFHFAEALGLQKQTMRHHLLLVAMLHDIGKIDCDKSKLVKHPLTGLYTIKRHSIMSLYAAMEILETEPLLSRADKKIIYSVIEDHDVSYALFREYRACGTKPLFERWKRLNNTINPQPGAGLLYMLIFKLADIHGHANIDDVTWFYKTTHYDYFQHYGLHLPVPEEKDIR